MPFQTSCPDLNMAKANAEFCYYYHYRVDRSHRQVYQKRTNTQIFANQTTW